MNVGECRQVTINHALNLAGTKEEERRGAHGLEDDSAAMGFYYLSDAVYLSKAATHNQPERDEELLVGGAPARLWWARRNRAWNLRFCFR